MNSSKETEEINAELHLFEKEIFCNIISLSCNFWFISWIVAIFNPMSNKKKLTDHKLLKNSVSKAFSYTQLISKYFVLFEIINTDQ